MNRSEITKDGINLGKENLNNEILKNNKNEDGKEDIVSTDALLDAATNIESSQINLLVLGIEEPTYEPEWVEKLNAKNNITPKTQLGVYYSYEYADRTLEHKDSIDISTLDYIEVRNASESFVESFRAGVFLRKTFKKGFRLSSGIEYSKLTERFDAAIDLGVNLIEGEPDFIEPTFVQQTNIKKIFNRYETINIPITLGKAFNSNKWRFYIDAGLGINLNFKTKGQIFSTDEEVEVLRLANGDGVIFKSKLAISYLASAGVSYYLNRDLSIELGPHWQSTFSSMNSDNYRLDTKHQYYGIKLGIIKTFR